MEQFACKCEILKPMKNSNLYKKDGQSTIYVRWNRIYDISWYIVFLQLRKLTFFVMTLTVIL